MRISHLVVLLTAFTLVLLYTDGTYFLRWLTVFLFGVALAVLLFGHELGLPPVEFSLGKDEGSKRGEVEVLSRLVKRCKSGKAARSILEERIIEIYALASEDYRGTQSALRSSPNDALRALRAEGDFLDNLERALDIVEEDLNED